MPREAESCQLDDGLACLVAVARWHGITADPSALRHEFAPVEGAWSSSDLLLAARSLGLRARIMRPARRSLDRLPTPCMVRSRESRWLLLASVRNDRFLVHDVAAGQSQTLTRDALVSDWDGEVLLLQPAGSRGAGHRRFGLRWFLPVIGRYRHLFAEVLLASLFVQMLALVTPLFFQVIVDKVLAHHSMTTLHVLAIGLLAVSLFEVLLNGLRAYVLTHTTNRIDVVLGSRLFAHLLRLPLAYFEARRVGDTVARVRELETLREFMTGSTLTLIVDLLFTVVFFVVLFLYSPLLAGVVAAGVPLYVLLSAVITPLLRSRLHDLFDRGAENQAFLVESVNGIQTLKTMAVEPLWQRQWEQRLADYVSTSMQTRRLGIVSAEIAAFINKVTVVLILWIGATLVMRGELTVGQLVAFNMIAGRISGPILRLVQLWQDLQQAGISMRRLGDVLDVPTEAGRASSRSSLPALRGSVRFEQVGFRYRADEPRVLEDINLDVRPGEIIGIVGHSGSGKSTLTRLVQRLNVPDQGRLFVDDVDLALVDPTWLRRQVGVVLQESVLFNRSVRDNIAIADPAAPIERVIRAARLAAAHEFIMALPQGYDTPVGEHGGSLSGGQRQRIAIARALLGDPRILIFDEATSALDYESELLIHRNMRSMCRDRTVFIIAHRLNAVQAADRILVMHQGRIVEQGNHDSLVSRQGIYARLHALQAGPHAVRGQPVSVSGGGGRGATGGISDDLAGELS